MTVRAVWLEDRWIASERDMSSTEKPLRGNPGSKCLMIVIIAPASELFLQLMYTVSIRRPFLNRYALRSSQKRLAVTVFPVPTPPVRNAVQERPWSARGRNRSSMRDICSSRWIRAFGT